MFRFWYFENTAIRVSERLKMELERKRGVMNDFKGFGLKNWLVRVAYFVLEKTRVEQGVINIISILILRYLLGIHVVMFNRQ